MGLQKKYSQTFFLSAGETDAEGRLSVPLLTSKIIDISTAHANSLGIGNPAMEEKGCGWVLSRVALEMSRYPEVNHKYVLTTWIESWNRHFSERIIMVSDADGNPYGYARTIWMVLDTRTRESVGLSHLHIPEELIISGECPIARQGRHVFISPLAEGDAGASKGMMAPDRPGFSYLIKYCDLDFYRHVNTIRYIALLLNRFALDEWDATEVERMELAFMHELCFGQEVTVYRHDEGLQSLFSIIDDQGVTALCASIKRRRLTT